MTQSEFLKCAYLQGIGKAAKDMGLSREELDTLVKEGQGFLRRAWGGVKKLFGRGPGQQMQLPFRKGVTTQAQQAQQKLQKAVKKTPVGEQAGFGFTSQKTPKPAARRIEPGPPPAEAPKVPTPAGKPSAAEVAAGREAIAGKRMTPEQVAETAGRETQVLQEGSRGGLGFIPSTLVPAALGAGVGYAAGGEQGALTGAGIGLGARLGAGGLLRGARELRGLHRLGARGAATPNLGKLLESPVARNALIGAGVLGAGGGALGHLAGRMVPRQEPESWYGGLGMSPESMGGLSQAAMPYLGQELGVSPEVLQSLGEQYGLVPPQMPQQMSY